MLYNSYWAVAPMDIEYLVSVNNGMLSFKIPIAIQISLCAARVLTGPPKHLIFVVTFITGKYLIKMS